jgi:hypothetical protein
MHYVCLEKNQVTGIFNYKPAPPKGVEVCEISDEENNAMLSGSHYFNVETRSVLPIPADVAENRKKHLAITNGRAYLNETDWMVLRHIREQALGLPTSMPQEEYLSLERDRHAVAKGLTVPGLPGIVPLAPV